jgi:drug/metabolite transporter (DMT)-like permease
MHESIPPVALAFWRWTLASLLVLPFVWPVLWRQRDLVRRHLRHLLALALLGVTGFNTLVYVGLQTTTATNAVLIQSTMPLQILLLNRLLFGAAASRRETLSIGLSLFGVLVIITRGDPARLWSGAWVPGDLWILGAALIWATYSVLLRWRPRELDAGAFLGFTLVTGTLALTPFYLLERAGGAVVNWHMPTLVTVAYVAVFPSALAYLFWNRGIALVGANAAGHFMHLMPVFGSLMAVLFLGERFGSHHALGASLVAAGIGLAWWSRRNT